ncbi:hypothetical protein V496_03333 [Pseudogymnoascus sp. VKM F-4515 (FW-2607)]|nr:hypothetical protein V496_03333 [Pseudogymnoascus sp. VKM F-4515 (FW-2607)]
MVNYKDMPKPPAGKNLKEMPRARADAEVIQKYASFARQEGFSSPEIERLTENFQPLKAVDDNAPAPITITTGPGVSLKRRCGLPHMDTFKADKNYLSLRNLYEENDATGEGITSFFALKSWFIAFFGPLTEPVTDIERRDRLPSPHKQDAIKDLTDIEQHQSESKDTNAGGDVDMMGSGGVVQAKASPTTSETREETLFGEDYLKSTDLPLLIYKTVPMNFAGSVRASEIGKNVCIKFVDLERNAGSMMEQPLENKQEHAKCLVVKHDDPESLVAQEVANYSKMGKRVCDRNERYIPAKDCYRVAIKEENKNTLFLTNDVGEDKVMGEVNSFHFQYQAPEFSNAFSAPRTKAADPEIKLELGDKVDFTGIRPHVPTNESNMLHQEPMVNTPPGEQQDGEESDSVLNKEKGNAANAHIYNPMTVICLKKVVASSYDAGKRREEMEWKDFTQIQVPTEDPESNVMAQMSLLSSAANLTPHNKDLRRLAYQDCYRVAKADNDHTLYLMSGDQGLPKNQRLVEVWPGNHRDKIGAASGKSERSPRKVGLSFRSDETHLIRKGPEEMRKGDAIHSSPATIKKRPKKEPKSRLVEEEKEEEL